MAETPVPPEHSQAFLRAVAIRLGLNPDEVRVRNVMISGGEPDATISVTAWLPADEVMDLFNKAANE